MPDIWVRPLQFSDREDLVRMRAALWPQSSVEEHDLEVSAVLEGKAALTMPLAILIAETAEHQVIGFLEVDLRSHADGCSPAHPVGYIEGWYVKEGHRQQGIGKKLVTAAEDWARGHGCLEIASDTWIDNNISQHAHRALGYEVVDRCVHYRKTL
jgi:aminoglycoside 6'-N-acetyltransferase I